METTYTFDLNTFSDLHKDAMGFRPSRAFFEWMNTANDDQLQAEWDSLIDALDRRMNYEAEREREAIIAFEKLVTNTIESGAKDRKTALRWIMDASICAGDWEFLCYEHGIPYGYFKEV